MSKTHKELTGYTEEALSAAFDSVANPDDWRAPIEGYCAPEAAEIVTAAVECYTATVPEIRGPLAIGRHAGKLTVRAAGYRAGPAGP